MSGTFVEAWDSAALSTAVCDELVKQGKIRTTPAFIRGDREAKITKVDIYFFSGAARAISNLTFVNHFP
jgi:hypothetical protein